MLFYHKQKLENLLIHEELHEWEKRGLINHSQAEVIRLTKSPAYKRSHVLYRIGVFFLTLVILISASGFWGLVMNIFGTGEGYKYFMLLSSFVILGILIFFIKEKGHFKTGVDDALLYTGLCLLIGAVQVIFNNFNDQFALFMVVTSLPILVVAAVSFVDKLLSILSFFTFLALLFLLALKMGTWGKALLPFIFISAAAVIYLVTRKMVKQEKYLIWTGCLDYTGYCAMVVFYLAGNYFVVRQASEMLMGITAVPGSDIPYAFIFYAFTVIVPLVYVFYGLKYKRYAFLNLGLLFIAVSILTFRYYYSILPLETALVGGGALLLVVSWLVIRYLEKPKFEITKDKLKEQDTLFNITAEALVIAQTAVHAPASTQQGTEFGGGEFGGGGAGGKY